MVLLRFIERFGCTMYFYLNKPAQHCNKLHSGKIQLSVTLRFLTDLGILIAFAPGGARIHIGFAPSGRVAVSGRTLCNCD